MKLMICGFGRVGLAFAELLLQKRPLLQDKYGLDEHVEGALLDSFHRRQTLPAEEWELVDLPAVRDKPQ